MRTRLARVGLLAILWGLSCPAQSDVIALDFSGGSLATSTVNATRGWAFDVGNRIINVTALGLVDVSPADPLVTSHQIRLWTSGEQLLASATVQPNSPLVGSNTRFVDLTTPVPLVNGGRFVIGADFTAGGDSYRVGNSGAPLAISTAPQISYVESRDRISQGFPDQHVAGRDGVFGPNFLFTPTDLAVAGNAVGGSLASSAVPATRGWAFHANELMNVSQLGLWDRTPGDPLAQSHQIGLWDSTGLLLASTTVQVDSPLIGDFRYSALGSSLLLAPGDYVIGAFYGSSADPYLIGTTLDTGPELSYLGAHDFVGGFGFPGTASARGGVFGPNFIFSTPLPAAAVAEPRTGMLLAIGLFAGLLISKGRRRVDRVRRGVS